jgi:hypothetical protein
VTRKAKSPAADAAPIEVTVVEPTPPVVAECGASRSEVQAAVRLLNAAVGALASAVAVNGDLRPAVRTAWERWLEGWMTFATGLERPVWNIDGAVTQFERQVGLVAEWRQGLKAEVGGDLAGWLFDRLPVTVPTETRARVAAIELAAGELDAPMLKLNNPGAVGAWTTWFAALKRYHVKVDGSWWTAVSGDTSRVLDIFAEQVEEWRRRLVRYERDLQAGAAGDPQPRPGAGAEPPGWPLWAKVAVGVGLVGGALASVKWVISHWASNTPVRVELPIKPDESKPEPQLIKEVA